MRMRKLGAGQSVTFCVSPEMQKRIRSLAHLEPSHPLTVTDILVCAIAETWEDTRRSLPLWAAQGLQHQHQELVWERAETSNKLSTVDIQDYMEDEAQSLEQRYRPIPRGANSQSLVSKLTKAGELSARQDQVSQIREKCQSFGLANLDAMACLQEEQERELAPEAEHEREVERPQPRKPAAHELHPAVSLFATSGIFNEESPAFQPAFHTLASTSAAKYFPVETFPSDLLATADFARTIQTNKEDGNLDAYQRPVQWLLTSDPAASLQLPLRQQQQQRMYMVLVSSWEANEIKKAMETNAENSSAARPKPPPVVLRAYLPRTSLSFESLEDLTVYTVPAQSALTTPPPPLPKELVTQLNLFAGQLYLRTYDDYVRLCRYLGLSYRENEGETEVGPGGFVGRAGGPEYGQCKFAQSPVPFLGVLFRRIRRDCLDIEKTHMGRVLSGDILTEKDFEESKTKEVPE